MNGAEAGDGGISRLEFRREDCFIQALNLLEIVRQARLAQAEAAAAFEARMADLGRISREGVSRHRGAGTLGSNACADEVGDLEDARAVAMEAEQARLREMDGLDGQLAALVAEAGVYATLAGGGGGAGR